MSERSTLFALFQHRIIRTRRMIKRIGSRVPIQATRIPALAGAGSASLGPACGHGSGITECWRWCLHERWRQRPLLQPSSRRALPRGDQADAWGYPPPLAARAAILAVYGRRSASAAALINRLQSLSILRTTLHRLQFENATSDRSSGLCCPLTYLRRTEKGARIEQAPRAQATKRTMR